MIIQTKGVLHKKTTLEIYNWFLRFWINNNLVFEIKLTKETREGNN